MSEQEAGKGRELREQFLESDGGATGAGRRGLCAPQLGRELWAGYCQKKGDS